MLSTTSLLAADLESMGFVSNNHVPTQIENEDNQYRLKIADGLARAGWRVIDGTTSRVTSAWCYFSGEVIEVMKNGVFVHGSYSGDSTPSFSGTFFVANFPDKVGIGEKIGDQFFPYAKASGTFTINESVYRKLDFGKVWTPPTPKPLTAEQIAAAKNSADLKRKASASAALKYNQDQAAKGDENGLIRMGERYRDGDGVERDLVKAREYFNRAAKLNNPTAITALEKLPSQ